jgi:hypothetical protein
MESIQNNNERMGAFTPLRVVCAEHFADLHHQHVAQCGHVEQIGMQVIGIRQIGSIDLLSTLKSGFRNLTNMNKRQHRGTFMATKFSEMGNH